MGKDRIFALCVVVLVIGYCIGGFTADRGIDPDYPREWCVKTVMTPMVSEGHLNGMTREELDEILDEVRSGCQAHWDEFLVWVEEKESEQK